MRPMAPLVPFLLLLVGVLGDPVGEPTTPPLSVSVSPEVTGNTVVIYVEDSTTDAIEFLLACVIRDQRVLALEMADELFPFDLDSPGFLDEQALPSQFFRGSFGNFFLISGPASATVTFESLPYGSVWDVLCMEYNDTSEFVLAKSDLVSFAVNADDVNIGFPGGANDSAPAFPGGIHLSERTLTDFKVKFSLSSVHNHRYRCVACFTPSTAFDPECPHFKNYSIFWNTSAVGTGGIQQAVEGVTNTSVPQTYTDVEHTFTSPDIVVFYRVWVRCATVYAELLSSPDNVVTNPEAFTSVLVPISGGSVLLPEDDSPPAVTGVSFEPSVVYTTASEQVVIMTVNITDNSTRLGNANTANSGVITVGDKAPEVTLVRKVQSVERGQYIFKLDHTYETNLTTLEVDPDDPFSYTLRRVIRIPEGSPPGVVTVSGISLHDEAGNEDTESWASLYTLGAGGFLVLNVDGSVAPDYSPPRVVSLFVSRPGSVSVGEAMAVTFGVSLWDESGFDTLSPYAPSDSQFLLCFSIAIPDTDLLSDQCLSFNPNDNCGVGGCEGPSTESSPAQFEITMPILAVNSSTSPPIYYPSKLYVYDKFGNSAKYGPNDLARFGGNAMLDISANLASSVDNTGPTLAWLRVEGGPVAVAKATLRSKTQVTYPLHCTYDPAALSLGPCIFRLRVVVVDGTGVKLVGEFASMALSSDSDEVAVHVDATDLVEGDTKFGLYEVEFSLSPITGGLFHAADAMPFFLLTDQNGVQSSYSGWTPPFVQDLVSSHPLVLPWLSIDQPSFPTLAYYSFSPSPIDLSLVSSEGVDINVQFTLLNNVPWSFNESTLSFGMSVTDEFAPYNLQHAFVREPVFTDYPVVSRYAMEVSTKVRLPRSARRSKFGLRYFGFGSLQLSWSEKGIGERSLQSLLVREVFTQSLPLLETLASNESSELDATPPRLINMTFTPTPETGAVPKLVRGVSEWHMELWMQDSSGVSTPFIFGVLILSFKGNNGTSDHVLYFNGADIPPQYIDKEPSLPIQVLKKFVFMPPWQSEFYHPLGEYVLRLLILVDAASNIIVYDHIELAYALQVGSLPSPDPTMALPRFELVDAPVVDQSFCANQGFCSVSQGMVGLCVNVSAIDDVDGLDSGGDFFCSCPVDPSFTFVSYEQPNCFPALACTNDYLIPLQTKHAECFGFVPGADGYSNFTDEQVSILCNNPACLELYALGERLATCYERGLNSAFEDLHTFRYFGELVAALCSERNDNGELCGAQQNLGKVIAAYPDDGSGGGLSCTELYSMGCCMGQFARVIQLFGQEFNAPFLLDMASCDLPVPGQACPYPDYSIFSGDAGSVTLPAAPFMVSARALNTGGSSDLTANDSIIVSWNKPISGVPQTTSNVDRYVVFSDGAGVAVNMTNAPLSGQLISDTEFRITFDDVDQSFMPQPGTWSVSTSPTAAIRDASGLSEVASGGENLLLGGSFGEFCGSNPCKNGGSCLSETASCACVVKGGFSGPLCDQDQAAPQIIEFKAHDSSNSPGYEVGDTTLVTFNINTNMWPKGRTNDVLNKSEVDALLSLTPAGHSFGSKYSGMWITSRVLQITADDVSILNSASSSTNSFVGNFLSAPVQTETQITVVGGELLSENRLSQPSNSRSPVLQGGYGVRSAPSLVRAVIEPSGLVVEVRFDSDTNMAPTRSVGATFSCSQLLNASTVAKLGSSSVCVWAGRRSLVIVFGKSATLVPSNVLHFVAENNIRSADSSSSQLTAGGGTFPSVSVQAPVMSFALAQLAVLPTKLSSCESPLALLDVGSVGASGRPLQRQWHGVCSSCSESINAGLAVVLAEFQNQPVALLSAANVSSLPADHSYAFSLTVTNWLGGSNTASVIVSKSGTASAQSSIAGRPVRLHTAQRPLVLVGFAAAPADCGSTSFSGPIKGEWSQVFNFPADEPIVGFALQLNGEDLGLPTKLPSSALTSSSTSGSLGLTLSLVPRVFRLTPGLTYGFRFRASIAGLNASDSYVAVIVERSPLEARIVGGNNLVSLANPTDKLVLDASNSFDPDRPGIGHLRFEWDCLPQSLLGDCFTPSQLSNFSQANFSSSSLTVPLALLAEQVLPGEQAIYFFTINVRSSLPEDSRLAQHTVFVLAINEQRFIPRVSVSVFPQSPLPDQRVLVQIVHDVPSSRPHQVSCEHVVGDASIEAGQSFRLDLSNPTVADRFGNFYALKRGVLQRRIRYTFRCRVHVLGIGGGVGEGYVSFTVISPPVGCDCTASSTQPFHSSSLRCVECTAGDGEELEYQFLLVRTFTRSDGSTQQHVLPQTAWQQSSSTTVRVVPPSPDGSNRVAVRALVRSIRTNAISAFDFDIPLMPLTGGTDAIDLARNALQGGSSRCNDSDVDHCLQTLGAVFSLISSPLSSGQGGADAGLLVSALAQAKQLRAALKRNEATDSTNSRALASLAAQALSANLSGTVVDVEQVLEDAFETLSQSGQDLLDNSDSPTDDAETLVGGTAAAFEQLLKQLGGTSSSSSSTLTLQQQRRRSAVSSLQELLRSVSRSSDHRGPRDRLSSSTTLDDDQLQNLATLAVGTLDSAASLLRSDMMDGEPLLEVSSSGLQLAAQRLALGEVSEGVNISGSSSSSSDGFSLPANLLADSGLSGGSVGFTFFIAEDNVYGFADDESEDVPAPDDYESTGVRVGSHLVSLSLASIDSADGSEQELAITDIGSSNKIVITFQTPTLPGLADVLWVPTCRFWNKTLGAWSTSGCTVREWNTNVTVCECTHLTDFDVQMSSFQPSVTTVGDDDFRNLTLDNLLEHPTTLIVILISLLLFMLLLPYAYRLDERYHFKYQEYFDRTNGVEMTSGVTPLPMRARLQEHQSVFGAGTGPRGKGERDHLPVKGRLPGDESVTISFPDSAAKKHDSGSSFNETLEEAHRSQRERHVSGSFNDTLEVVRRSVSHERGEGGAEAEAEQVEGGEGEEKQLQRMLGAEVEPSRSFSSTLAEARQQRQQPQQQQEPPLSQEILPPMPKEQPGLEASPGDEEASGERSRGSGGDSVSVSRSSARALPASSRKGKRTQLWRQNELVYRLVNTFRHRHLWLSVAFRHPRDRVNSVQRLSMVLALVLGSMAINATFYGQQTSIAADVVVAIISSIAVMPVTVLIMVLFRGGSCNSAPVPKEQLKEVRQPGCCPVMGKRLAWALWTAWCLGSILLALVYGLQFDLNSDRRADDSGALQIGESLTARWLVSVLLAMLQDFFINRPILIALRAYTGYRLKRWCGCDC